MSRNSENNNYSLLVAKSAKIVDLKDTDLIKIGRKNTINKDGYSEYYTTLKNLLKGIKKQSKDNYFESDIVNADVLNIQSSPKLVLDASTLNLASNEIVVITKARLEVIMSAGFNQNSKGEDLRIENAASNIYFEGGIFGDSVASVPLNELLISSGAPRYYYGSLPTDGNNIYFIASDDYVGAGNIESGLLKVWYRIETIG